MTTWGPFGIGKTSTNTIRLNSPGNSSGAFQVKVGTTHQTPNATIDQARESLSIASAVLADAFRELTNEMQPIYSTTVQTTATRMAMLNGLSARRAAFIGSPSILDTTIKINTQSSTNRSSASNLGLDLTAAASNLYSADVGLDITSAEARSKLFSSAGLGLDVTSPEAASWLRSAEALGLDLTSPDAPSRLYSALALGLDITSPETVSTLKSSATLALDITSAESASTIASTAEMNTAAKSFSSYDMTFAGSTSHAQLSGDYTGAATQLKIRTTAAASLSGTASALQFNVLDQSNNVLGSFSGNVAAGEIIDVASVGIKVSFTAGTLGNNRTATTNVVQTATTVSTTALFNAAWSSAPRFENFQSVAAGSFTVNGTAIAVNADDSISSVISRINSAGAGVTASVSGDKITLAANSNTEDDIVLANDTSGFLAATKLAAAATAHGNIRDDQQVLSKTTQFGSVSSGSFTINGQSIAVDRVTDTLNTVIGKINSANAGVTASYDSALDKLVLTGTSNSEDLITVANDTTGFLAAAHLATGNTVRGNIRDDQQVLSKTTQFGGVSSGSVSINGQSIAVDAATDTLDTLITKINNANAGVTASYDSALDKLVLVGTTNNEDLIVVDDDTTGFLTAAHLATSNTIRGHFREDEVEIGNLSEFQSVGDGSFVIDGQTIEVDIDTDTIQSLVAKINGSGARVTASYDSGTDNITLQATYNSEDDVPIGSDTSGFLAAAHLDAGDTVKGNIRDDQQVLSKTSQFDDVTDGSFRINGQTISVDASQDTVSTIVGKINGANAGVTASFNASANKIELVTVADSEDLIVVDNDTAGFLAEALLSTANTVRGNIRDDEQVLSKTSQFGAAVSGTFTVNGQNITVNTEADTLNTLIDKINNAGAGVTVAYDSLLDKLVLTSTTSSEDVIAVEDDTTGILSAAGLVTGNTVRGSVPDDQQVFSETSQFEAVNNGSFDINGVSISVDVGQDTLQTVIARINGAGAGVTAAYDSIADKVTFTPDVAGSTLSLENDTSGFLTAANVAIGTVGTHVNAGAAFNATGLNGPLFDPGVSVHAGAFTVNGVEIAVAADDSIDTVVARITASAAGVTATYDDTTQTVTLTSNEETAVPITVADDTSGFLAAVKLDGTAVSTPGAKSIYPYDSVLNEIPEYAAVSAGTLTLNGHQITIDPETTTLRDLVSELNNIPGLSAAIDENGGRVNVSAGTLAGVITVSDDSGLLSTLKIEQGTFRGARGTTTIQETQTGSALVSNSGAVAGTVWGAVEMLNEAVTQFRQVREASPEFRAEVEAAILYAIESLGGAGVKGVGVREDRPEMTFFVDGEMLAGTLAQEPGAPIAETDDPVTALGTTLAGVMDQLTERMLALDLPPTPVRPTPAFPLQFDSVMQAQLAAQQVAGTLSLYNSAASLISLDVNALRRAVEMYTNKDHVAGYGGLKSNLIV